MNAEALYSNWLTIGTDNKSATGHSLSRGRILTGAKGLGRLGIDRLCKKLILYTKTKEMDTAIQLNVNWKQFENTSLSLSEIKHEIYEVELPIKDKYGEFFLDKDNSGTRMLLLGLKDDWNEEYLEKLENELRLLISPFQSENEFSIKINTNNGDEKLEKTVSSEKFLNIAAWKVTASVSSDGFVSATFTNNQKQFDIKYDQIAWGDWIKGKGEKPAFGPVECELHYLKQDHESLKKVDLKARDLQRFMALNRGFRIYRDNFRVRPYGEPSGKGDWLDIGYRKAQNPGGIKQGGFRIGPNQILGAVLISRNQNAALYDQANREGLVENEAFFQLRTFILKIIETFELLAHKDAAGDKNTDLSETLATILAKSQLETDEAINDLKKSISSTSRKKKKEKKRLSHIQVLKKLTEEIELARQKQRGIEAKYLEALRLEKRQLEEQKDTLSNLASLGILTVCFGHEIRQHSSTASADASELASLINDAERGRGALDYVECKSIIASIKESTRYVENFSSLALKNIKPDKRTRKKVNIPSVFKYVLNLMSDTLTTMGVSYELIYTEIEEHEVNVMAYEIDWESIAINLTTNSLWAMERILKDDRKIQVEFSSADDECLHVRFRDSGIGLEEGMEEHIFLPMQSGKRDLSGNTIGTGMGLAIVKNHIVDHVGGEVFAVAKSQLGGAEFLFKLPILRR
jgi:hypothetical protein